MFTEGQWMFAVFFVIAFAIAMVISYRKDIKLHKKYYKGSLLILAGFALFIIILFLIKTFLH
ncbi:hypothetical protein [Mesonia sp.]|uniref:hypothetical protein n=1 Tax=Mesonia sp. TaxID=1960830 RepID=UPI00176A2FE7|nr:hypothetical protein [Mesonia sp.]HIB37714.1 hypothetical protein [Mesonia sp.]HIO26329.1 hypothetical protein [Flavobacteriaceae bacterium]